jgi:hypothetical protein
MQINGHSLELKKIKSHRGMEGQTLDAELHFDGQLACLILDDATGGEVRYDWDSPEIKRQVEDVLLAMPPVDAEWAWLEKCHPENATEEFKHSRLLHCRLEQLVDRLYNDHQALQTWKRRAKTQTLYRNPGQTENWYQLSKPLSNPQVPPYLKQKYPDCEVFNGQQWVAVQSL